MSVIQVTESTGGSSSFGRLLPPPTRFLLILVACLAAATTTTAYGQAGMSAGGAQSSEGRHVLLSAPHEVDGQPVVRIVLEGAGEAVVGHVPDAWSSDGAGSELSMSGPALGEDDGKFRLDIPEDAMWEGARFRLLGPGGSVLVSGVINPPADYPELEVHGDASAFLLAPAQASAGEVVRLEIKDEDLIGVGKWKLAGVPIFAAGDTEFLSSRIPGALRPGQYASISFDDAYGLEIISDQEAIEIVGSTSGDDVQPALTGCTPRVFRGRMACICGVFPTSEIQGGLMLDGQPLGVPNAASSQVVYVEIPESVAPGTHTITGAGIEGSIEIVVLAARGEIDLSLISEGGTTPLRVIVEGTEEPLQLVLRNLAPEIVELEGGVEQVVETTGGAANSFERTVTGLSVGDFDVYYELAQDPCPCLENNDVNIAENDPGGTRERNPQGDSTGTRPPWWPEEPDDDDPRDVPIPPVYGEEEDEEEDPACCGFRGPLLLWPQTTDPMAQGDPMVAPHSPAVGGVQVHLATGAYFHNDRDLNVEARGLSFDLLRHYTSDVETMSGGLLGHRWDFNYNKRLVALGRDYAEGLRGQMVGTEQSVVMYFDGMGRVLRYAEKSSDWRPVSNFGSQGFRAYVTTYESPVGEFNELQRYVLEKPADHPFAGHNDIDENEAIFFVMREKNGVRYVYNCRGQLLHILARNDYASLPAGQTKAAVRFTFQYSGPRNPLTQNTTLSSIEDPSGHFYSVFTRDIDNSLVNTNDDGRHITGTFPIPRIRKITGGGVEIRYTHADGNSKPVLEKVTRVFENFNETDSVVTVTEFKYTGEHLLAAVVAPEQLAGNKKPYIENTYSPGGRVQSQRLGDKAHSTLAYSGNTVTVTSATGPKTTYLLKKKGDYQVVEQETVEGAGGRWVTSYEHNDATQVVSTTLPRGNKLVYRYDGANESVTKGPMRNDVQAGVTYHNNLSLGNLLSVRRERGTVPKGDGPDFIAASTEYEPLYNQASKLTDGNGNVTEYLFEYDEQGYLGNPSEEIPPDLTQPDGSKVTLFPRAYSYNDYGQLEAEAATPLNVVTYAYNEAGYLIEITDPHGNQSFSRDFYGLIQRWEGPEGTIRYTRDPRGLTIEESRDPYDEANKKRFAYDLNGNLVKEETDIEDNFKNGETLVPGIAAPRPQNKVTRTRIIEVDMLGRPVRETSTGGGLTYEVKREFDVLGQVVRTEEPSPAGGTLATTYEYDARGHNTREVRGDFETTNKYDENGNLVESRAGPEQGGRRQTYTYDPFDRGVGDTNPLGAVSTRKLDGNGNVLSEEVRGTNGAQDAADVVLTKTEKTYNEKNLVVTTKGHVLDSGGTTLDVSYFYNRIAEVVRAVAPGNSVTQFGYDTAGRLTEIVDPVGNKTKYEYGKYDQKTAVIVSELERTYEPTGRKWTETVKEYKTVLTYDVFGRVLTTTSPEGASAYRYNSDGKRRLAALRYGGLSETQYDAIGRQVVTINAGETQKSTYTVSGLLAELEGPHLHKRWKYDAQGLEVESTDVLTGARSTTERDKLGNPTKITDANGTVTTRTFNALGLPLTDSIIRGDATVRSGELELQATLGPADVWRRYDGLGRLTYAQNGKFDRETAVGYAYDGIGRVTSERQIIGDAGQNIVRTYANDNSWAEVVYPEMAGRLKVRQRFDALGRVVRVDADGEMVASYAYTGADRLAGQTMRNGTVAVYSYDDKRRLTSARVFGEGTAYHGNPTVIYSNRASYTEAGRLKETVTADIGANAVTTTAYTYDRLGRVTRSESTTGVTGSNPSTTVSTLLTTFDGNRPSMQAELLTSTHGETPAAVFARVQKYTYDGARVRAVATVARDKFSSRPPDIDSAEDLRTWITGDGAFSDTQTYEYDAVGNLIRDDVNVYQYDSERRLIRVGQIPANRPYNQATFFAYDPLGRRVKSTPWRDNAPNGFVNWDPWTAHEVSYLYDGDATIGEVTRQSGVGFVLLARYLLGARPGERVRMDRRLNDDVAGDFRPYYLHASLQGQIGMITDSEGIPLSTQSPSSAQAGFALAPPDDERFIAGSRTRTPYLGWNMRIDGYAGIKYDENSRRTLYDYRASPRIAEALNMAAYRQSITAMQNRGALALAVATGAALAPGAALFQGLLNVGMNWTAAAWTDSPYTPSEVGEHLAQGALAGGLTKLIPGGSTALQRFASDYVSDFAAGVTFDVGLHNRSWGDAVSKNIVTAAVSAGLGAGIRLGISGVGLGFSKAMAYRSMRKSGADEAFASQNGPAPAAQAGQPRQITGDVFSSIVGGRRARGNDIAFQQEMLSLLMKGTPYHRHIARLIMRGEMTVHWDANLPAGRGGEWSPSTPTAIYLNPRSVRRHPSGALEAASLVVHEATHAMGGGEPAAFLAQGGFIAHWWFGKGVRTTSFGSQRVQYSINQTFANITRAYGFANRSGNPWALKVILKQTGYHPNGTFFMPNSNLNPLHMAVFNAGGWGNALNLHPTLDAQLHHWARGYRSNY